MEYKAVFEPAKEGGYVCWLEEIPAIQSQGETLEEARENLIDAWSLSMEYLRERDLENASAGRIEEILELA
jgi:predicted RNase H-like HicB family nuclease